MVTLINFLLFRRAEKIFFKTSHRPEQASGFIELLGSIKVQYEGRVFISVLSHGAGAHA